MATMNVSLTDELERFVDGKVESGLYNYASEVVREGLRLLKESDDFRSRVRESIERGWLQAQAGELVDGPTAMAEGPRAAEECGQEAGVKRFGSPQPPSVTSTKSC